jgi:hypothetical protein
MRITAVEARDGRVYVGEDLSTSWDVFFGSTILRNYVSVSRLEIEDEKDFHRRAAEAYRHGEKQEGKLVLKSREVVRGHNLDYLFNRI